MELEARKHPAFVIFPELPVPPTLQDWPMLQDWCRQVRFFLRTIRNEKCYSILLSLVLCATCFIFGHWMGLSQCAYKYRFLPPRNPPSQLGRPSPSPVITNTTAVSLTLEPKRLNAPSARISSSRTCSSNPSPLPAYVIGPTCRPQSELPLLCDHRPSACALLLQRRRATQRYRQNRKALAGNPRSSYFLRGTERQLACAKPVLLFLYFL